MFSHIDPNVADLLQDRQLQPLTPGFQLSLLSLELP